jgi:hypothetical protein
MTTPTSTDAPHRVFLFSGHMIDAPGRRSPRFPPAQVPIAAHAIALLLDQLEAAPSDLAICGGACGGDLLFAQAALARGVQLELYLPFEEPKFLAESVDFAGADWHARFDAAKTHATVHSMPHDCPPVPEGQSPYEHNNQWMLDAASRFGAERLHFICLWNGQGADGPGGTRHLLQKVRRRGGQVHWLDTTRLWN